MVSLYVIVPGLLLSLIVQHRWRRTRIGFYVGIVTLVIGMLLQCFIPPAPAKSMSDAPLIGQWKKIEFAPDWPSHLSWSTSRENGIPYQQAYAPLVASGLDSDSRVSVQDVVASFQPSGEPLTFLSGTTSTSTNFTEINLLHLEALQPKLPGIALSVGSGALPTEPATFLFKLSADKENKLRGRTGTLTLQVSGQVRALQQMVVIPLDDPHYIARIPGGFMRVAPLDGDRSGLLTLWAIAPQKSSMARRMTQNIVTVLVDPQARTGKVLSSDGNAFSLGGIGTQLEDSVLYYKFSDSERKAGMVLYVFEFNANAAFQATLTAPAFKMTPPDR